MTVNKVSVALLAVIAGLSGTGAAHATLSIACTAIDGSDATVELGMGTLPILAVIGARIDARGMAWAINPQAGETEMISGEGAHLGDGFVVRFTDPNVENIIAEVRVLSAQEKDEMVSVAILRLPETGVIPMTCEGP